MDPLTHALITCTLVGKDKASLAAGVGPDLPFWAVYYPQVFRQGGMRHVLITGDWPEPPPGLTTDPLVYQGGSGVMLGATDDIALAEWTSKRNQVRARIAEKQDGVGTLTRTMADKLNKQDE